MDNAWAEGRPVLLRLPAKGYGDNDTVAALTDFADAKLMQTANTLQNFYKELDPVTAQDNSLDYLAYLVGLSGNFWDSNWSTTVKRNLIAIAHPTLWRKRGTLEAILAVLDIHGLTYNVYTDNSLRVPFKVGTGATIGTAKLRLYIRLPLTYQRSGKEFREVERTLRNYAPAVIRAKAVYSTFRVGFSKVGEPVFSS